jgi:plasmid stability protein
MPSITVKNVPADLYERLRQAAQANRRSINAEIIVCIERAVSPQPVDPELVIARARALRERTARYRITDDELGAAKVDGRP